MGKKSRKNRSGSGNQNSKSAHVPAESTHAAFNVGETVVISGLKQAIKYNGKIGVIISKPADRDSRYGVSVDGKKIAILPSNMKPTKQDTSAAQQKSPYRHPPNQKTDLDEFLHHANQQDSMNADQMEMMRMMMDMFLTEEKKIQLFGRKIKPMPNFRDELLNEGGGFPRDVDPAWANDMLRTAFEESSDLPHSFEIAFKSETFLARETDFIKRLGTNDPAKLDWYFRRPRMIGDIFPRKMHPYSSEIRHSYSNQTYKKQILHRGTTHVAVGFVDLGMLLEADLRDPPSLRAAASGPLLFLGVEMSPYAVAKTLVIWEMLRHCQGGDDLRHVMQAWFSTTWGKETESRVKRALEYLYNFQELGYSEWQRHPEVVSFLLHWRAAGKMSLKSARTQWANRSTSDRSAIGYLERKQDRIAMARYELTGDFGLAAEESLVSGNILMFDCPEGAAPLRRNETVFSALNFHTLVSILSPNKTIIEAAEQYVMERLSIIAQWARNNMVTLRLICSCIEDVTDLVADSNPWTMSWSNVIDYIDYAEFHHLARACSIHGNTLHFGYSMNWPIDVWGVNILDFVGEEYVEFRKEVLDGANEWIGTLYKSLKWDRYLRMPPPTNPINTTCYLLEMNQYKKWADHFFGISRRQGPCQVGGVEHDVISPLSPTGSSTVSFTWTYDPEMKLEEKSRPDNS